MAKNPKKTNAPELPAIDLLAIVAATNAGSFVYVNDEAAKSLVEAGMIEVNPDLKNEAGEVAARATANGIASMNAPTSPTGSAPAAPAKPVFAIEMTPALPAKKARGGRTDTYPFADLPAPTGEGDAKMTAKFFVPATGDKPEPWNSLSSTVSAASKRYATKSGEEKYKAKDGSEKTRDTFTYSRKFRIFEGEREGVKGAWIERTI